MIVVTGAAGFIGSALVKKLNELAEENILIVDRIGTSASWHNLKGLKFADYMQADVFLTAIQKSTLRDISLIYHMGACSSTTEMDMDFLMANNFEYSKIVFDYCVKKQIPFCYASSAATYGLGEQGYSDDHKLINKLRPLNPYGYSKQLFDYWVLLQKRTPPLWYGCKFFNVYGPNEYHKDEMRSLVAKGFDQITKTGQVKLFKSYKEDFKDGCQLRDFVYVKDVVNWMLALVQENCESGLYNMGTGQARSFYDLIDFTFQALGKKTEVEFIEMPEKLRNQYQYFTEADMSKLKRSLKNFSFSDLKDGVFDYVQNYLSQDCNYFDHLRGKSEF